MKKVVFSGIQPSGNLHIGNYIGAISQWAKMQDEYENYFCIVDLHAITVPQDPKTLREKIYEVAALYIAAGIDPKKSNIFIQSENPDHPYLAWVLNCLTPIGYLNRMTQFKSKSKKASSLLDVADSVKEMFGHDEKISAGLFDYPVLMASDILLYQTDEVPVGEDQKQHIELTRDLAEKFNSKYGETFKLPNPHIPKTSLARIMSLQNPAAKMSKSDIDPMGTINLLDSEEEIREKIKRAVTDSESAINKEKHSKEGAVHNLLVIYSVFADDSMEEVLNNLDGMQYGEFKNQLADLIINRLSVLQKRYKEIRGDENYLRGVLKEGLEMSRSKSQETVRKVKELVGLPL